MSTSHVHVELPAGQSSARRIAQVLGLGPGRGPRYRTGGDAVDVEFDDEAGKWLVTAWCATVVSAEACALQMSDTLRAAGIEATAFDLDPSRPLDHVADPPTRALQGGR